MTADDSNTPEIRCYQCGNPNVVQSTPVVPIAELEALADDMEDPTVMHHSDAFINQKRWAQELREVIEQYE